MAKQEGAIMPKALRIVRHIRTDLPILWSNDAAIQHTEQEFLLTFFQIQPPLLIEPTKEDLENLETVDAEAVARSALTPQHFQQLVENMVDNLRKYQAKQKTQ